MADVDLLIINAGQLVTCTSPNGPKRGREMLDVGIIENGAVAINDGEISAVGETPELQGNSKAAKVLDAEGRVVCPGFVDPHTHIVYAGDRLNEFELKINGAEYLEILASGGGIASTVRSTREASKELLVASGLKRLDKMLACGTTTCEIKTGYGLELEAEIKMLESIEDLNQQHSIDIVPTFLAAHTIPPEFKNKADAYVEEICDLMLPAAWGWYKQSTFGKNSLPFFCDVFTEQNAFDLEQSRRILEAANSLGFHIKSHVDQFTNLGGTKLSLDLGATSVDHLDAISDDEIAQLAESDTVGVVIPTENFSAGKMKFADARRMIDSGCAIAISTDFNPGSAPCPSQPMAMAIATRYQKLMPSETMNAATINAAHAIGLGDRVGSIEKGKSADLLILDCEDYRQISYEFGGNLVDKIVKRGVVLN